MGFPFKARGVTQLTSASLDFHKCVYIHANDLNLIEATVERRVFWMVSTFLWLPYSTYRICGYVMMIVSEIKIIEYLLLCVKGRQTKRRRRKDLFLFL